jgi:hypothetical protein
MPLANTFKAHHNPLNHSGEFQQTRTTFFGMAQPLADGWGNRHADWFKAESRLIFAVDPISETFANAIHSDFFKNSSNYEVR